MRAPTLPLQELLSRSLQSADRLRSCKSAAQAFIRPSEVRAVQWMTSTLALLKGSLNKQVLVKLKGGRELRGILKSFDQHLNLLLEDAEEVKEGRSRKFEMVLIRGDNVILISPAT